MLDAARAVVRRRDRRQRARRGPRRTRTACPTIWLPAAMISATAGGAPAGAAASPFGSSRARSPGVVGTPAKAIGAHAAGSSRRAAWVGFKASSGALPSDCRRAGRRDALDADRPGPAARRRTGSQTLRELPPQVDHPRKSADRGRRRARSRACRRSRSRPPHVMRSGVIYGSPPIAVAVWKLSPPSSA